MTACEYSSSYRFPQHISDQFKVLVRSLNYSVKYSIVLFVFLLFSAKFYVIL